MSDPMKSHERAPAALDDPRAVDILTTEHWSLLSARTLGDQEMFGRTTIFVAVLSGAIVALAFLAQATHFNRDTMVIALLLLSVVLFTGLATFARCVTINLEDVVGTIASDLAALCGAGAILDAVIGLAVSIISGALHVRYAARFRRRHAPSR